MNEIIDILTPSEIGERLQLVRQRLSLTQKEVATEINSTPLKISKIEQGSVVTTPDFIRLLAFYSQSVSLDVLFSEKIDFVTQEHLFDKQFALTKVVKEKLLTLQNQTQHQLSLLSKDIGTAFDTAIDLL